ncbi:MAG: TPM domain-containing protein [Sulfurospirillaceae bacterium]|nr:TPM domain-containing protein [Sulfurospirillaceae bacterium]
MISIHLLKCKKFILFALFLSTLFLSTTSAYAEKLIFNDGVLINKTEVKMEQMGNELLAKTGVRAYLYAIKDINNSSLFDFEKHITQGKKSPFVVLMITLKEQKVDIISSPDISKAFDKAQILSPYPWSGSIIPLLVGKKQNVSVSAAMLNGYADLVEQIASSKDVKLTSGIGSTNRDIVFFVKISIYLFLLFIIVRYFIARTRKRQF